MSKLTTSIKGTTFYKIDFAKIKQGDQLFLERDKENTFDKNAIRVIHHGTMLGHIDKNIAAVLAGMIDCGTKIYATINKMVGGYPRNTGIIINLSIFEDRPIGYYTSDGDSDYIDHIDSFIINETNVKHSQDWKNTPYDRLLYYKSKYKLQDRLIATNKPGYENLRITFGNSNPNFLLKLLAKNELSEALKAWEVNIINTNKHNSIIDAKIAEYNSVYDENDYLKHKKLYYISQFLAKYNIHIKQKQDIESDIKNGYITTYELLLYEKLHLRFWMLRQAIIQGYQIDMLLFNLDTNEVWGLEVDGGIHRRLRKYIKDCECSDILNKMGISLIRVNNMLIQKDIDNVVDRIQKVIFRQ